MATDWRKEMLSHVKTPLKYAYGCIFDAEGHELAYMNRMNRDINIAVIFPVERDELAKELVKRFNEYKKD